MRYLIILLVASSIPLSAATDTAVFTGGCFWCMEPPFEKLHGVTSVVSGYMGGTKSAPTYEDVSKGNSGYREAVQIIYDTDTISYDSLLTVFWRNIDPTDNGGQFADRGRHYKTAIFTYNEMQKRHAVQSKKSLARSGKFAQPIVTEILPATRFYAAEEEHQDFYITNPDYYLQYKKGSGRENFLKLNWEVSMPEKKDLRNKLTALQYHVTQENGTEPPFNNEYYTNKRDGIYVDIVSGEPLFWSGDKYNSGSGWPSFTKPLISGNVIELTDSSHGMVRTEVRSKGANSHLGHLFHDGPAPEGLRYCINSASMRFIAKEDLEKEGYGEYSALFKTRDSD